MRKARKILIIGDHPDLVRDLRLTLQGIYDVFDVSSSLEGLGRIQEVNPDLIILDVEMAGESQGLQTYLALRGCRPRSELAAYVHIPILILTSSHQKMPLRLAADSDHPTVDSFMDKPAKPGILLARIKKLLTKPRRKAVDQALQPTKAH